MAKKTPINRISGIIDDILNNYSDELREEIDKVTKTRAFASANIVKSHAESAGFQGGEDYIKAISARTDSTGTHLKGIVHVKKPHYRLAHLLEHGHVIKNKYGTYGRTKAFKHWEPAEKEVNKRYEEEITKVIESVE